MSYWHEEEENKVKGNIRIKTKQKCTTSSSGSYFLRITFFDVHVSWTYSTQTGFFDRTCMYYMHTLIYYLNAGNFCVNLILRFLKGDISRHLIFVILENFTFPRLVYCIKKCSKNVNNWCCENFLQ